MRGLSRSLRPRIARRIPIAVLGLVFGLVASLAVGPTAQAGPTKAELDAAQTQLDSLNQHLSLLVEQYDQARITLQNTQARLDRARRQMAAAQAQETRMQGLLSDRARAAYEGGAGSALDVVLGATSFQDLTDRLEFVNSVVQSDAQVANAAEAARIRAREASIQLTQLAQQRQATLTKLGEKKSEIEAGIADQQALVNKLKTKLAQEAAAAAAAKAARQEQSNGGGGGGPAPNPFPTQPAPSPSSGAFDSSPPSFT